VKQDATKNEMRKGFLILAVLKVLTAKKLYTAEILSHLNSTEFDTQEGTLYPLLSKLRRDGLIDHEWVESRSGPPRKYYCLTEDGIRYASELTVYSDKLQYQLNNLVEERKIEHAKN
jgi:PadR family transcriptional regulator, regulatory protein PadR